MREPKIVYRCNECYELHDEEYDAMQCCNPDELFQCQYCNETYRTMKEAHTCSESHTEQIAAEAYAERMTKLEAMGQERLFN